MNTVPALTIAVFILDNHVIVLCPGRVVAHDMGVVPQDSVSINLAQCQLPRETHTQKAAVTGCQRLLGTRRGALVCSLKAQNTSVPPFSCVLTDRLALTAAEAKPALAQMH